MKSKTALQLGLAAAAIASALAVQAADASKAFPPLGPLPPAPIPADNPMSAEKVELGKKLFWDNRLSGDNSTPCVSCHLPELGWGDGGAISRGYPGTKHWRNSQTILNSAYYNKLFWEGNVTSLESQAPSAAEGGVAGNGDRAMMEMRLRFIPEYVEAFRKVFGAEWPRMTQAYIAIAAYQRTVVTDASKVPFDRWLAGDKAAMSEAAVRGEKLYKGKAGCIQCHNGPLASDQRFYSLGLAEHPDLATDPMLQITHRWEQYQKGVSEDTYRTADRDYGYYYVTKDPKDKGKFRVPSLRELKWTAPYMHNGTLATLADVVEFYNRGGGDQPGKSDRIKALGLSDQEKQDLVAFLEALSMTEPLLHSAPELPGDYKPLN